VFLEATDVVSMTDPDFGKNVVPPKEQKTEPTKPDSTYRHYFHILKKKVKIPVLEYDFDRFGTLVEAEIPPEYEQIDRYWVEKGRSLVVIALNTKTSQKEYLLSEPALSEFEYELLERLYEDLRDVLILSSDEIKKDPKRILLEKINELIDDYGITPDSLSLFKIQYI